MTQLIRITLFSLHIIIPIVIVLSIQQEKEDCSLTFKNDILLHVVQMAVNSEVKCLNRTEIEKEEKYMPFSVGGYVILCTALDPIEFYFEGDNMTPLMEILVSRYFPSNQQTFRLVGGIYQGNTGRYGCRKIHNTSYHNSAYLFVSETAPPYLLQSGLTLEIFCDEDIILLPCKSGNAFSSVHLYKIIRNKELLMENSKNSLWYDRTKGFYLNTTSYSKNELYGKYICRTDTKTDYIKFNLHPPKGYRVSPGSDKLEVRPWSSVHLKCQTIEFVGFKWDHEILKESDVNITSKIKEGSKLKASQEIVIAGSALQNLSTINISCGSHHNWILTINADGVHPDDLKVQLSDSAHSINCTSPKTIPMLTILPCTNRLQCDIRTSCFQRLDECTDIVKFEGRNGRSCLTQYCNYIISPPSAGVINCSDQDTVKIVQYFTGFDKVRYQVDSYAPMNSLLKLNLSQTEDVIYSGTHFVSTCEAIGFIFSQEIVWAFGMRDGNLVHLEHKVDCNDTKELGPWELISRTSSLFAYSTDIVKLFCFVPLINSTDLWMNVSMDIEVIESKIPVIMNEMTSYVFNAGDANKYLICLTDGTPTAEATWQMDNKTTLFETLTVTNSHKGVGVLNFPVVNLFHAGYYTCRASNFRGTAFKSFIVTVEPVNSMDNGEQNYKKLTIGLGIGGIFLAFVFLAALRYLCKSVLDSKKLLRELSTAEVEGFLKGAQNNNENSEGPLALPYDQLRYEISMDCLEISNKLLGSGAHGKVFLGELTQNEMKLNVAVKTLNENADVIYFKALLSELKIMIYIGHQQNIICLHGAHTSEIRKRKIFLVMEFCPNGDLLNFLREHRKDFDNQNKAIPNCVCVENEINEVHLKSWVLQIAEGMEYLSERKIVLGDLAARNILLTNDLTAKITDFGLSKQLYQDTLYMKKKSIPLPWRWMSIEGIKDMIFSSESDMWSFGILMWEIFSLGEVPYPGINYDQSFIKKLQSGFRNLRPAYASPKLYKAMERAWSTDPISRPTFPEMVGLLHVAEVDETDFNYTVL